MRQEETVQSEAFVSSVVDRVRPAAEIEVHSIVNAEYPELNVEKIVAAALRELQHLIRDQARKEAAARDVDFNEAFWKSSAYSTLVRRIGSRLEVVVRSLVADVMSQRDVARQKLVTRVVRESKPTVIKMGKEDRQTRHFSLTRFK